MIDVKHTCEQCPSYKDNEPCGAGKNTEPYDLVGDCNIFEEAKSNDRI